MNEDSDSSINIFDIQLDPGLLDTRIFSVTKLPVDAELEVSQKVYTALDNLYKLIYASRAVHKVGADNTVSELQEHAFLEGQLVVMAAIMERITQS